MRKYFNIPNAEPIGIDMASYLTLDAVKSELIRHIPCPELYDLSFIAFSYAGSICSEYDIMYPGIGRLRRDTIDVILFKSASEHDCMTYKVDVQNHYRIWFSDKPDVFLPPLERVTIEESINATKNCITTLILDKSVLSEEAKEQANRWSRESSCQLLDLSEIHPENEQDKMILSMAKNELKHSCPSFSGGNLGIASDLIRLLFADKGVYLDCDIFTMSGIPEELECEEGYFVNTSSSRILNNDVMAFSSEQGKRALNEFKRWVIEKYFSSTIPSLDNLEHALTGAISKRMKKLSDSGKEIQVFFKEVVLSIAGPCALSNYVSYDQLDPMKKEKDLCRYFQFLKIDAKDHFLALYGLEQTIKLSWLPGNNVKNYSLGHTELFRQHLIKLNQKNYELLAEDSTSLASAI